jgi:hypothetical protein
VNIASIPKFILEQITIVACVLVPLFALRPACGQFEQACEGIDLRR